LVRRIYYYLETLESVAQLCLLMHDFWHHWSRNY